MAGIICFDPDECDGAAGVLVRGKKVVLAGTEICRMPEKMRSEPLAGRLEQHGFFFFYGNEPVDFPWYAVPRLYVFARDGQGCFFAARRYPDMEEREPVWRVSRDGSMALAAPGLSELIESVLADRSEKGAPGADARLYSSRDEAERDFEFVRA